MSIHPWIAKRMQSFDSSGIRKVFNLAAKMANPINLSIGQPDFEVPQAVQDAAITAIREGKNGYTQTQGIAELRNKLSDRVRQEYPDQDRGMLITSGTSGGLVLAILSLVDPGDEVILFDPYFVMYQPLVSLAGGNAVLVDTYPDFRIDLERVRSAITRRTKAILFNSPANPTGAIASEEEVRGLAELAQEHKVVLVSDEIYRSFAYDQPFVSPAKYNPQTLVLDGFSKTYAVTGWRMGYAHGPASIIEEMTKLQQYTFVCAPQPMQWAGITALEVDMCPEIEDYRRKRDRLVEGIKDLYEVAHPGGAFYAFPKAPWGTASEFVETAIANELLIIPGLIFSQRDTHFRVSYAAPNHTIERGIEVLRRIAKR